MSTYELHLKISKPKEEDLSAAEGHLELLYSSHGESHFLTIWQDASIALEAAQSSAAALRTSGIHLERAIEDLVTRQDIADRLNISRQAVSNWVRGTRHGPNNLPFPEIAHPVGGGIWLWADINRWANGMPGTDSEIIHLGFNDCAEITMWLMHDENRQNQLPS